MQIHALMACSLLVIPPPKERVPPPGGFPTDLSDLNLLSWAGLVQDIASGLLALPPNLGSNMSLPAVALLQLLEKATGWGFCHYCCHLASRYICMGAYSLAPLHQSYCLLRRHDRSHYHCSEDVQVRTTPTRPPSDRLFQLEAAAS